MLTELQNTSGTFPLQPFAGSDTHTMLNVVCPRQRCFLVAFSEAASFSTKHDSKFDESESGKGKRQFMPLYKLLRNTLVWLLWGALNGVLPTDRLTLRGGSTTTLFFD
jgi:hypothetical protein